MSYDYWVQPHFCPSRYSISRKSHRRMMFKILQPIESKLLACTNSLGLVKVVRWSYLHAHSVSSILFPINPGLNQSFCLHMEFLERGPTPDTAVQKLLQISSINGLTRLSKSRRCIHPRPPSGDPWALGGSHISRLDLRAGYKRRSMAGCSLSCLSLGCATLAPAIQVRFGAVLGI